MKTNTTESIIETIVLALGEDARDEDAIMLRKVLWRLVNIACLEQMQRVQEDVNTVYSVMRSGIGGK
jgi:hypothetical protein